MEQMDWTIPGTTLRIKRSDACRAGQLFSTMYMAGDITLSQVCSITGLESYMVQNWVKRGFLTNPRNKHYTLRQLCRIININMLRNALPMEKICGLLAYVNGELDDDADDLIDDSALYFMFVELASRARHIGGDQEWGEAIREVVSRYEEPVPGARERVAAVLRIMLTAWIAASLRVQAEEMIAGLEAPEKGGER